MVCSLRMGNVILALEIGGIDFFLQLKSLLSLCPGVTYLDLSQM